MRDLFCWGLYLWGGAMRPATIAAITIAGAICASAQTTDAVSPETTSPPPPYSLFQYSTLTGSGRTILATRVPVVLTNGSIVYKNLTLLFDLDSLGNLTVAPGYPQVVPSVTPIVSNFLAGKYVGPSNVLSGEALITVAGPSATSGGATEWSLAATTGAAGCTYPSSAMWWVGPIANSPLAARLKAAGITSTAWSYGVTGGEACYDNWLDKTLIGVSQTGNTLSIVSFTFNGTDKNEPVDQITYTLSTR